MVETPQIELVKQIRSLQNGILESYDRQKICCSIRKAIQLAIPVAPFVNERLGNTSYKYQSKSRAIELLSMDLNCIENNTYHDWELVHFQTSASMASLMLVYADSFTLTRILN